MTTIISQNKGTLGKNALRNVLAIVIVAAFMVPTGMNMIVQNASAALPQGPMPTYGQMDPLGQPHQFGPYSNYVNSPMPKGSIGSITVDAGGAYYFNPTITIDDVYRTGSGATASATVVQGVITKITVTNGGNGYTAPVVLISDFSGSGAAATANLGGALTGGIRKFVDSLPGVNAENANNLGNYIPIAIPDSNTFPNCDYYEIALVRYTQKMHSDLPATLLQGYVQLETPDNAAVSKHVQLKNPDGSNILMPSGAQAWAVDQPRYLGPIILSQRDRPTRVTFYNLLPTGSGGDLFLPVDTTMMGSGTTPNMIMPMGTDYTAGNPTVTIMGMMPHGLSVGMWVTLKDFVPAIYNGDYRVVGVPNANDFTVTLASDPGMAATTLGMAYEMYTQNRATLHLHGGVTPWISDGTPHQWTTPAGENTNYPKGVSVEYVPDMWFKNNAVIANTVGQTDPPVVGASNNPGAGALTFYYTNQQSARLMFYHDHAYGITRLNVYSGEAAGYLLTDPVEQALIDAGILPNAGGVYTFGIPLHTRTRPGPGAPLRSHPTRATCGYHMSSCPTRTLRARTAPTTSADGTTAHGSGPPRRTLNTGRSRTPIMTRSMRHGSQRQSRERPVTARRWRRSSTLLSSMARPIHTSMSSLRPTGSGY
jgi:hypothetical protein